MPGQKKKASRELVVRTVGETVAAGMDPHAEKAMVALMTKVSEVHTRFARKEREANRTLLALWLKHVPDKGPHTDLPLRQALLSVHRHFAKMLKEERNACRAFALTCGLAPAHLPNKFLKGFDANTPAHAARMASPAHQLRGTPPRNSQRFAAEAKEAKEQERAQGEAREKLLAQVAAAEAKSAQAAEQLKQLEESLAAARADAAAEKKTAAAELRRERSRKELVLREAEKIIQQNTDDHGLEVLRLNEAKRAAQSARNAEITAAFEARMKGGQ